MKNSESINMSKGKTGNDKSGKTPAAKTQKQKRADKVEKRKEKLRSSGDM